MRTHGLLGYKATFCLAMSSTVGDISKFHKAAPFSGQQEEKTINQEHRTRVLGARGWDAPLAVDNDSQIRLESRATLFTLVAFVRDKSFARLDTTEPTPKPKG